MHMIKTVQTKEEAYVQFTDEEMEELGIKENDEFEVEIQNDGILLKKMETVELNLEEFPREILEFLVKESCDKNVSCNKIIRETLEYYINSNYSYEE